MCLAGAGSAAVELPEINGGSWPAVICAGWLLRAAALRRQREAS